MGTAVNRPGRKVQAQTTKQRILKVALDTFSEHAYDEVAVGDIAARAGVAHGLLFHYFKNKRGMYLAAMEEASRELDEALAVDPRLSPGAQLRQLYNNQFQYLTRHRGLAMRLVLGGKGADPEAWRFFEENRWRAIEWGMIVLGLDPESPSLRIMMRSATAAVDEAAAYWHMHGRPFDLAVITEVLLERTISALQGAARLDPSLDVDNAIDRLRE